MNIDDNEYCEVYRSDDDNITISECCPYDNKDCYVGVIHTNDGDKKCEIATYVRAVVYVPSTGDVTHYTKLETRARDIPLVIQTLKKVTGHFTLSFGFLTEEYAYFEEIEGQGLRRGDSNVYSWDVGRERDVFFASVSDGIMLIKAYTLYEAKNIGAENNITLSELSSMEPMRAEDETFLIMKM